MKDELYQNTVARLDTIIGGDTRHFLRIQRARNEYNELYPESLGAAHNRNFFAWVLDQYGIQLEFDGENVCLDYSIRDEKKYMMFVLKYDQ
jgi:hypothetical protein